MKKLVKREFSNTFKQFYEGVNGYFAQSMHPTTDPDELTITFSEHVKVTYRGIIQLKHHSTNYDVYVINIGENTNNGWIGHQWLYFYLDDGIIDAHPIEKMEFVSHLTGEVFTLQFEDVEEEE